MSVFRKFLAPLLLLLPFWSAACAAQNTQPGMVAAAHPLAARAGAEILEAGGSAVDAAIAVQAVLSLVEPQSSGIGGGAFLVYYDASSGTLHAYDGREAAPAAADETLFLDADGKPRPFPEVMLGGRAVGVPGIIAMFDLAHRDHGVLPWNRLFDQAISLAEEGFAVSPRLNMMINRFARLFPQIPETARYFLDADGHALPVGHRLKNPEYARTLRDIAEGGAEAFYQGPIAEAIVDVVREAPVNPGLLTMKDMAAYRAKDREPLCRPYRVWDVCGMPPPTSGGVAVLQILGLLERFDLADLDPESLEFVHLMGEASRLAYADRAVYLADPDHVDIPVAGLLDRDYLAERSALIDPTRAMPTVAAGTPPGAVALAPSRGEDPPHTSHFSIVDRMGNVLSMTTSVQIPFGSSLMVKGFILNNQLTDFDFAPMRGGEAVANRPGSNTRPRSSMSPTIVFDDLDRPILSLGSPGGGRIIGYVAQSLVAILDQGLSLPEAFALPHHGAPGNAVSLEAGTSITKLKDALEAMGHKVQVTGMESGLHGIRIFYEDGTVRLEGGADPRREGIAPMVAP